MNPFVDEDDECDWGEPVPFGGEDDIAPSFEVSAEFKFARWLHGIGYTNASDCESHVRHHCQMNEIEFDEYWIAFDDCWERVKYPDCGQDMFAVAVQKSQTHPAPFPPDLRLVTDLHRQTASIAYHLAQYTGGHPFLLPVKRLFDSLKLKSMMTATRIIRKLESYDVIRCVDHSSSKKHRKAKKYILGSMLTKRN